MPNGQKIKISNQEFLYFGGLLYHVLCWLSSKQTINETLCSITVLVSRQTKIVFWNPTDLLDFIATPPKSFCDAIVWMSKQCSYFQEYNLWTTYFFLSWKIIPHPILSWCVFCWIRIRYWFISSWDHSHYHCLFLPWKPDQFLSLSWDGRS